MELHRCTAMQLRRMLAAGEITAKQLTRHYFYRIARIGCQNGLNAVYRADPHVIEYAKKLDKQGYDPTKPLWGLPILVKDNIDVAGMRTTAGSFALEENFAQQDAPIIANLRKNGAIILGKTNMTEFANYTTRGMPGGFSSLGGQVIHAHHPCASPSGSSSGSGVAMSVGLCALAVGTDTSFSVVACAAANGVVGLKPAHGTLPTKGIVPIAHTLDSAGAMTRTLEDALLLVCGMSDAPFSPLTAADPSFLRIAVNISGKEQVSAEQLGHYERLFAALRNAGTAFEEIEQPPTPLQRDIMRCEFREDLEAYLASSDTPVKTLAEIISLYESAPERMPYGIELLKEALPCSTHDEAYLHAMHRRDIMRKELCAQLERFDAVVMTGPTNVMHFTGLPSLSLTLCADQTTGLPCGIILYGADETRLLRAALAIEKFCLPMPPPIL